MTVHRKFRCFLLIPSSQACINCKVQPEIWRRYNCFVHGFWKRKKSASSLISVFFTTNCIKFILVLPLSPCIIRPAYIRRGINNSFNRIRCNAIKWWQDPYSPSSSITLHPVLCSQVYRRHSRSIKLVMVQRPLIALQAPSWHSSWSWVCLIWWTV